MVAFWSVSGEPLETGRLGLIFVLGEILLLLYNLKNYLKCFRFSDATCFLFSNVDIFPPMWALLLHSLTQAPLAMDSTDRAVLFALFQVTGGASWPNKTNWGTDVELWTWFGVTVDDQSRVVKLDLKGNNLRGACARPSAKSNLLRVRCQRLR